MNSILGNTMQDTTIISKIQDAVDAQKKAGNTELGLIVSEKIQKQLVKELEESLPPDTVIAEDVDLSDLKVMGMTTIVADIKGFEVFPVPNMEKADTSLPEPLADGYSPVPLSWRKAFVYPDQSYRVDLEKGNFVSLADIEAMKSLLLAKIRGMPNRDDFLMCRIGILDGGGVGKFDVIKIIENYFGDLNG